MCACYCVLGYEKDGCQSGDYNDYLVNGFQCEACVVPAQYENVAFFYTQGYLENGEFSSCIINTCSDRAQAICEPGEYLQV